MAAEKRISDLEAKVKRLESEVAELRSALRTGGRSVGNGSSSEESTSKRTSSASDSDSLPPSAQERLRYMNLSEGAKTRVREEVNSSREKLANATPEEKMKHMDEIYKRIEEEEKARGAQFKTKKAEAEEQNAPKP